MKNTAEELNNLRYLLSIHIVRFTFLKKDGTLRHAVGTRNIALAERKTGESIAAPASGRENPYAYFDIEKLAWRSYCPDSIMSIDGIVSIEPEKPVGQVGQLLGGNKVVEMLFAGMGKKEISLPDNVAESLRKEFPLGDMKVSEMSVNVLANLIAELVVEKLAARLLG